MGNESKVHDFKTLGHSNLAKMAKEILTGQGNQIAIQARAMGHDAYMPVMVKKENAEGKLEMSGTAKPTSLRGKMFTFAPTKERVTVTRPKVGQNYNGAWVHEVTNRAGKTFLAANAQLTPVR